MVHMTLLVVLGLWLIASALGAAELRVGMIGLDTSHVTAFTSLLNNPAGQNHIAGARVVAAFKGGSLDMEASFKRIDGFTKELTEKWGVKLYESIEELCQHVDAVMIESVDGRPHLAQAKPVIAAHKPLFVDKPLAGSLRDGIEIFRLARAAGVPVFSSSALRFAKNTQAVRQGSIGKVARAETAGPCSLEPHHPDLFFYGIHGVEALFTVMGTGCESVERGKTAEDKIEVTGTWAGGRKGTFRESKDYVGKAWGEKGEADIGGNDGYHVLLAAVVQFFQTGVAPVPSEETLEMLAFMEAADESKRQGGAAVSVQEVLKKAGN
jgi:hypothetical protein